MLNIKTRRLRQGLVIGGAAGTIMMAGAAFAQSAPAPAPDQGANAPSTDAGDIVVTANKRQELLRNVAMGISAISGDELVKQQLVSFADYVPLVPGLSIQSISPTENRVTIRGLNANGAGASVGIYVDDTPVGSSNGLAGGSTYTANSDTWDLQRVEVLRGPQGTLYGANTEGGLIKFVSNAPDLRAVSGTMEVGAQAVDGGNAKGSAKGVINLPLITEKLALRVSGYYEGLPGYIDDPQLGIKNANEGHRWGIRGSLLATPTDNLKLRVTGFYQDTQTGASPFVDVVGNASSYAAPPANQFQPTGNDLTQNRFVREPYDSHMISVAGSIEWKTPIATVTSITSYTKSVFKDVSDVTSSTLTYNGVATPTAPIGAPITYGQYAQYFIYGVPTSGQIDSYTPLTKWTQEVRIASNSKGPLEWQLGGFATHESGNLNQQYAFDSVATGAQLMPLAGGTQLLSKYTEIAGFATATYHFTPRLDLELGGRYAHNKQSDYDIFQPGLFSNGPFTTSVNSGENVFTYSVAPRFKVTEDTLIYGRVASGFKPGGPNNVTVPGPLPAGYPLQYGSEKTTNYELGLRTGLLGNHVTIDTAVFDIEWTNIQIYTRFGNFSVRTNGGNARSRGLEWALGVHPLKGLAFTFNGAYVDARIKGTLTTFGLDGQRLPYVPGLTSSLDGSYRWKPFGNGEAFVGATYAFTGSRTTGLGNLVYNPVIVLPDYGTLAAHAGLGMNGWRAEIYAKNLTNSRGITTYVGSGTPGPTGPGGSKGIIDPRTFGITLTKSF